jgi:Phospholipase A2
MKPLTQLMLTLISLATSCGLLDHRRTILDLPTIENFEDLLYNVIKKSNKVRMNSLSLLEFNSQHGDDELNKLINVLTSMEPSSNGLNPEILQRLREVLKNYCGPGNLGEDQPPHFLFPEVDSCCQRHDFCNDYINITMSYSEIQSKYPGLPRKNLLFTSLSCDCDADFYNCMKNTKMLLGEILLKIYSVVQTTCFKYDYKVEKCSKYDE